MFPKYEPFRKTGVEEAKVELAKLIEMQKFSTSSLLIQRVFRKFLAQETQGYLLSDKILPQISDLKKLKSMLGDRLKLIPLDSLRNISKHIFRSSSAYLIEEMADWITESLKSKDPNFCLSVSLSDWPLIKKIAHYFSKHLTAQSILILNLIFDSSYVEPSEKLYLFDCLCTDNQLIDQLKRLLELRIQENNQGEVTDILRLVLLPYNSYIENPSVNIRPYVTFIMENVLTMPNVLFYLKPLQNNWDELYRLYIDSCQFSDHRSIFLFSNTWDLMIKNDSFSLPMLMICARLAKNITLENIDHSPYIKGKIEKMCKSSLVTSIFKSADDSSVPFLCEIYSTIYQILSGHAQFYLHASGIMSGIAFNSSIMLRIYANFRLNLEGNSNFLEEVLSKKGMFCLFCSAFSTFLSISDDEEYPWIFQGEELVLFTKQLIRVVQYSFFSEVLEPLQSPVSNLLKLLHSFNTRLNFLEESAFLLENVIPEQYQAILKTFPFCLPFQIRVNELYKYFAQTMFLPVHELIIRREHLMSDSLMQLSMYPDIRGKLSIRFVNAFGMYEEGIDAGGLFKEFWTTLSRDAFNPQYGLFCVNQSHCLYPNPDSGLFFGEEHLNMFYHVGRILGKAIFERITVEPSFAEFFLRKMIGKFNFIEDLKSLDTELHQNLRFLKYYEGNAADLALNFTVSAINGDQIDLIPNGRNLEVNDKNKLDYIYKLADYKLNEQIKGQCKEFFRGFNEIVPAHLIKMFTPFEMQTIISGSSDKIDIENLRSFTQYVNCSANDEFVLFFWEILHHLSSEDQSLLLRFVTSCSRSPLFGFENLHPPFTIAKAGDTHKLPTAHTCVNTIDLPAYPSLDLMHEKLIMAIRSGAGFDFK